MAKSRQGACATWEQDHAGTALLLDPQCSSKLRLGTSFHNTSQTTDMTVALDRAPSPPVREPLFQSKFLFPLRITRRLEMADVWRSYLNTVPLRLIRSYLVVFISSFLLLQSYLDPAMDKRSLLGAAGGWPCVNIFSKRCQRDDFPCRPVGLWSDKALD